MARLRLDHYCHPSSTIPGSSCSSYLAPPKKGAMPKSPGYSSITNSFPSTVLPAGFFTTPRRTFRVFVFCFLFYPENFPGYLETFHAIRKFSGSSGKNPAYPETFHAIQKLSRLSRNFTIIRKILSLSGNVPGYPEIFQIILKISSLSGNFPGYTETSWTIWKISRLSGNFPDYPETF